MRQNTSTAVGVVIFVTMIWLLPILVHTMVSADEVVPPVTKKLTFPSGPTITLDGKLRHMMFTYSFDPSKIRPVNSDCKELIKEVRRLKGKIKHHSKKKIRTGHKCNVRFSINEDVCGWFAAFVRKGEQKHSVITSVWDPKINNLGCR